MSNTVNPPHRYLARVRNLLSRLEALLHAQETEVRLGLLGVDHSGHFQPALVPELAGADLVTLELPTTPVRAYLEGRREEIHVRNIFWQDLLEHFSHHPPRCGVFGVNVNPHVRYLRARFYYRGGVLTNDFDAPAVAVQVDTGATYTRSELGGSGDAVLPGAAVPDLLPEAAREQLLRNGMAHVGPRENPFGPERHLVVVTQPPAAALALADLLASGLAPVAAASGLEEEAASRLAFTQLMEGFLLPVNDFYLIEQLLRHVLRAVEQAPAGACLRVTHVAGYAHVDFLSAYLRQAGCERLRVEAIRDPRFPLHPAYMVPAFFARELERTLAAVSLHREEFQIDLAVAGELLAHYLAEEPEHAERRVLLRALWTRDLPPPEDAEFHSFSDERPLHPSRRYLDDFATQLDRRVLEHVLAELPLPELRAMNDRLRRARRRGMSSALAQELQELGWGYRELREHPAMGRYARRVDQLREALLEDLDPSAIHREAFR